MSALEIAKQRIILNAMIIPHALLDFNIASKLTKFGLRFKILEAVPFGQY